MPKYARQYVFSTILAGAAIGFVVGGGIEIISQLIANGVRWECIDINRVVLAAAEGMIMGTLGGWAHGAAAVWGLSGAGVWAAGFMFEAAIGTAWDMNVRGASLQDALVNNVLFALAFEGAFEGAGRAWNHFFGEAADDIARAADVPSTRGASVDDFNTGGRVGTAGHSEPNVGNSVTSRRTWYADSRHSTTAIDNNILAEAYSGNPQVISFLNNNKGSLAIGPNARAEFTHPNTGRTMQDFESLIAAYDIEFVTPHYPAIDFDARNLQNLVASSPGNRVLDIDDARVLAEAESLGMIVATSDQRFAKRILDLGGSLSFVGLSPTSTTNIANYPTYLTQNPRLRIQR